MYARTTTRCTRCAMRPTEAYVHSALCAIRFWRSRRRSPTPKRSRKSRGSSVHCARACSQKNWEVPSRLAPIRWSSEPPLRSRSRGIRRVAHFEDKSGDKYPHGPWCEWVYPELLAALKLGRQGMDMSTRGTQSYGKAASIPFRHCPREPWRETKVEKHRVCLICVSFCAHVPSRNETASVPDRRQPQAYSTWFTT